MSDVLHLSEQGPPTFLFWGSGGYRGADEAGFAGASLMLRLRQREQGAAGEESQTDGISGGESPRKTLG